ncbi:MAG TPA: L-rhamnose mutarotase [Rectinemataceae bacterium]
MARVAFVMKLKPGSEAEYKRRHDEIWPDMKAELKAAGISDYSIYLDADSLCLFAVQTRSADSTADSLKEKAIVKRWWAYMGDIMETNPDGSPRSHPLREVFHLD